jgi:hypothetical protein
LTHSLRSSGAKRFAKLFDQTFDSVDQLIFAHIQPAIQNLFALLSQLEAMASWKERMEAIGISEGEICEAKKTAGRVLLRVESLLRSLARHRTQVTDLFSWLQKAIGLLELDSEDAQQQQQAKAILSKLVFSETRLMGLLKAGSLSTDPIAAILGEPESERRKKAKNPQDIFRRNVRTRLFEDSFGPSDDFTLPSEPLSDLLKKLSEEISSAFASVGTSISKNMLQKCQSKAVEESGALLIHDNADNISNVCHHVSGRKDALFAFVHNATIWLLRFSGSSSTWDVSGIDASPESRLHAVTFYSPGSVAAILCEEHSDTSQGAELLLIPVQGIEFSSVEMDHVNKSQGLPNFFDNIVMARPFDYPIEAIAEVKRRAFPKIGAPALLCVAPPRGRGGGLAALLGASGKRIILVDLESEEDPEEPADTEVAGAE